MPRRYPQPFWREQTRCYYLQLGKRQIRLSADKAEAYRLYHELMRQPEPEPARARLAVADDPLVVEILDAFLEWTHAHKAPATYEWYRHQIQMLASAIPTTLTVGQLTDFHLDRVILSHPEWKPNTKWEFARAVQRAFNWAVKKRLLEASPLRDFEKETPTARKLTLKPAEFDELMAAVREPNFATLLRFCWESGCRPQEVVRIEGRFVDFETRRIVFPVEGSKGKRVERVIQITPGVEEILKPLVERHQGGVLFRNSEGQPWNKNAINSAFCRLKEHLGRKLHLGALRKSYATEALKNGVNVVALMHLMGHSSTVMIQKVYAKPEQDPFYMAEMARKAKGQ